MTTDQEEQAEKRRTLLNDARVRNGDTGTYLSHTHDDTSGGTFASLGAPHVVGSTETPKYPAAAAHQHDPCGPEPPLSPYDNSAFESSMVTSSTVEVPGDPADAPSSLDGGPACPPSGDSMSERAGSSPFSQKDEDNG